jgi:hypothetical protein
VNECPLALMQVNKLPEASACRRKICRAADALVVLNVSPGMYNLTLIRIFQLAASAPNQQQTLPHWLK